MALSRHAGDLVISVADNGPGLPPRARENLFVAFEGSARAGGTGLGLAIAREITEAHGGRLVFVDQPQRGEPRQAGGKLELAGGVEQQVEHAFEQLPGRQVALAGDGAQRSVRSGST